MHHVTSCLLSGPRRIDGSIIIHGTVDENKNNQNGGCASETHVIQTIHRGQRFSAKLKRRLTIRTIAEAKALKKQSKDAIHILFYAAELVSGHLLVSNKVSQEFQIK